MDRRTFLATTAGALYAPLAPSAQQTAQLARIGWLLNGPPQTPDEIDKTYRTHLRRLGWIEGQNMVIERRYSGGLPERLKAPAEELARLNLDLIVADGTIAALALRKATSTRPSFSRGPGTQFAPDSWPALPDLEAT